MVRPRRPVRVGVQVRERTAGGGVVRRRACEDHSARRKQQRRKQREPSHCAKASLGWRSELPSEQRVIRPSLPPALPPRQSYCTSTQPQRVELERRIAQLRATAGRPSGWHARRDAQTKPRGPADLPHDSQGCQPGRDASGVGAGCCPPPHTAAGRRLPEAATAHRSRSCTAAGWGNTPDVTRPAQS